MQNPGVEFGSRSSWQYPFPRNEIGCHLSLIETDLTFYLEQTGEQLTGQQQDHACVKDEDTCFPPTESEPRQVRSDQIQ
jgi:hypothetical protein